MASSPATMPSIGAVLCLVLTVGVFGADPTFRPKLYRAVRNPLSYMSLPVHLIADYNTVPGLDLQRTIELLTGIFAYDSAVYVNDAEPVGRDGIVGQLRAQVEVAGGIGPESSLDVDMLLGFYPDMPRIVISNVRPQAASFSAAPQYDDSPVPRRVFWLRTFCDSTNWASPDLFALRKRILLYDVVDLGPKGVEVRPVKQHSEWWRRTFHFGFRSPSNLLLSETDPYSDPYPDSDIHPKSHVALPGPAAFASPARPYALPGASALPDPATLQVPTEMPVAVQDDDSLDAVTRLVLRLERVIDRHRARAGHYVTVTLPAKIESVSRRIQAVLATVERLLLVSHHKARAAWQSMLQGVSRLPGRLSRFACVTLPQRITSLHAWLRYRWTVFGAAARRQWCRLRRGVARLKSALSWAVLAASRFLFDTCPKSLRAAWRWFRRWLSDRWQCSVAFFETVVIPSVVIPVWNFAVATGSFLFLVVDGFRNRKLDMALAFFVAGGRYGRAVGRVIWSLLRLLFDGVRFSVVWLLVQGPIWAAAVRYWCLYLVEMAPSWAAAVRDGIYSWAIRPAWWLVTGVFWVLGQLALLAWHAVRFSAVAIWSVLCFIPGAILVLLSALLRFVVIAGELLCHGILGLPNALRSLFWWIVGGIQRVAASFWWLLRTVPWAALVICLNLRVLLNFILVVIVSMVQFVCKLLVELGVEIWDGLVVLFQHLRRWGASVLASVAEFLMFPVALLVVLFRRFFGLQSRVAPMSGGKYDSGSGPGIGRGVAYFKF